MKIYPRDILEVRAARAVRALIEADEDDQDYKDVYEKNEIFEVTYEGVNDKRRHVYRFYVPSIIFPESAAKYYTVATFSIERSHELTKCVEEYMRILAHTREYPPGAMFRTEWGDYLIHDQTVTKI